MRRIPVTRKTARLLRVLLSQEAARKVAEEFGDTYHVPTMEMMKAARMGSGSFYPLIARLEEHGWVEGEWEIVPEGQNRPRRRFYHLTEPGRIAARQAVREDSTRPSLWQRLTRKAS